MELSQLATYVGTCAHDAPAPCSGACPFGLDVRAFLKKAGKGRVSSAYRDLRTALVFPSIAAELCPRPCTGACLREKAGGAMAMGLLEQAVIRLSGDPQPDVFQIPEKDAGIAVVGAGPAGLALALHMARKKYRVTVFEKSDAWGGSLRAHPKYSVFQQDISRQLSVETIDFRYGHVVTDLSELSGFRGVYVATGEGGADFGLLSGWDSQSCRTARQGVFCGGGICGMPLMESMAAGAKISVTMETLLQTGRMPEKTEKSRCFPEKLTLPPVEPAQSVAPADPETGYTKAELKQEAGRCLQCNCDMCMKDCGMLAKYGKAPEQIAMELMADSGPHFLSSRTMTRQTYSCNLCGNCKDRCPEGIDLGTMFQMSRTARVAEGIQPEALHDFWLRELDSVSGECALALLPPGQPSCRYVFFPGCRLPASLPEQTIQAGRLLTETFQAGVVLGCCGVGAWWAGDQKRWEANSQWLRQTWSDMGRPVFVLACATCELMLSRLVPEIQTVSLYRLLGQVENLTNRASFPAAAIFDPCAARDNDGFREDVRKLAQRFGYTPQELPEQGHCCGWGGHMRTANPALYQSLAERQAGKSDLPYLVYCANCREVFLEQGKECRHILETLLGTCDRVYYLHEKHENRLRVKEAFMKELQNQPFTPPVHPWDGITLLIDRQVQQEMEANLIDNDTVKECIWCAREQGGGFVDQNGVNLACLKRSVMTYWVEYTETPEGYRIQSAYCHRMRFEEVQA